MSRPVEEIATQDGFMQGSFLHLSFYDQPLGAPERALLLACDCPPGCVLHPERWPDPVRQ